jgi:hypothetical protein
MKKKVTKKKERAKDMPKGWTDLRPKSKCLGPSGQEFGWQIPLEAQHCGFKPNA